MWREIRPEEMTDNVFRAIGKDWMLIGAGDEKRANAMTASWGGMGILWGKPVATVYLRPQRYTKGLVDAGEYFTLSFYEEQYRKALNYMGTVSGADEDKIGGSGLTLEFFDGAPAFSESRLVLVCRKLYAQTLDEKGFFFQELVEKNYPQKDYHTMYIGEIVRAYVKDAQG